MKKKKESNIYVEFLRFIIYFIVFKFVDNRFGEEIKYYYKLIPKSCFTIIFALLLGYLIVNYFTKRNREVSNSDVLYISSENDYASKDTSLGIVFIYVLGVVFYYYLVKNVQINYVLGQLIVLILLIKGNTLTKTASFTIKKVEVSR